MSKLLVRKTHDLRLAIWRPAGYTHGDTIAYVEGTNPEHEKYASLFAAAPDMLSFLKAELAKCDYSECDYCTAVKALIAQAEAPL